MRILLYCQEKPNANDVMFEWETVPRVGDTIVVPKYNTDDEEWSGKVYRVVWRPLDLIDKDPTVALYLDLVPTINET